MARDTLHVSFAAPRIHRGNLFVLLRRLGGFSLIGFYAGFVFAVFRSDDDAALAAAVVGAVPGVLSVDCAKQTYSVPYPQPDDAEEAGLNPCVIHITHLPPNYAKEELLVMCQDLLGFKSVQFYGKYCYATFATHNDATAARFILRKQTNLVVTFAKPKPVLEAASINSLTQSDMRLEISFGFSTGSTGSSGSVTSLSNDVSAYQEALANKLVANIKEFVPQGDKLTQHHSSRQHKMSSFSSLRTNASIGYREPQHNHHQNRVAYTSNHNLTNQSAGRSERIYSPNNVHVSSLCFMNPEQQRLYSNHNLHSTTYPTPSQPTPQISSKPIIYTDFRPLALSQNAPDSPPLTHEKKLLTMHRFSDELNMSPPSSFRQTSLSGNVVPYIARLLPASPKPSTPTPAQRNSVRLPSFFHEYDIAMMFDSDPIAKSAMVTDRPAQSNRSATILPKFPNLASKQNSSFSDTDSPAQTPSQPPDQPPSNESSSPTSSSSTSTTFDTISTESSELVQETSEQRSKAAYSFTNLPPRKLSSNLPFLTDYDRLVYSIPLNSSHFVSIPHSVYLRRDFVSRIVGFDDLDINTLPPKVIYRRPILTARQVVYQCGLTYGSARVEVGGREVSFSTRLVGRDRRRGKVGEMVVVPEEDVVKRHCVGMVGAKLFQLF
ncbi:hypothetical protein HDU79_011034 [Rhizoclosmatium sp. JEL0117]|nr:hypothetical protein HDU79_011034 [Rhizoclosmatium sp. JEL0117]